MWTPGFEGSQCTAFRAVNQQVGAVVHDLDHSPARQLAAAEQCCP
jgi:hypothetical protein